MQNKNNLSSARKEQFVGRAQQISIQDKTKSTDKKMYYVTFEDGARTNFHYHKSEQILIATEGKGKVLIAERRAIIDDNKFKIEIVGEFAIEKGTAVCIRPGIFHCHGSTSNRKFSHIAINSRIPTGKGENTLVHRRSRKAWC